MANRLSRTRFPGWSLWIIGTVSVLAAAILLLAVVLGLQVGQRQLDVQRRQQVGIHLQRATDYRAEGRFDGALDEYQEVLLLDPGNQAAVEGIESLFRSVTSGNAPVVEAAPPTSAPATAVAVPTVATTAPAVTAAASPSPQSPLDAQWEEALAAYQAGDWQQAITQLERLRTDDPAYRADEAVEMLYNAYVNLAAAKDNAGSLEEALTLVDKALLLRPDAQELRTARALAAKYLDVQTYEGADWAKAIALLVELYASNPGYRDVEQRLAGAYVEYADGLAAADDWCAAAEQYASASTITTSPAVTSQRDLAQAECDATAQTVAVATVRPATTPAAQDARAATPTSEATSAPALTATEEPTATPAPTLAPVPVAAPAARPTGGRILYAVSDPVEGRMRIFSQPMAGGQAASILVEDGDQPSLRSDGQRLLYRNLRNDMRGLSAFDPASGLLLRFSEFAEDVMPSWNPEGNRYAFASDRSGDRRWRVYVAWAEESGEASPLGFGETPAWHPAADAIAFRGCDETGNRCGLWTMNSSGTGSAPITSVPADTQPSWSPDGRAVVFSSNGRDGNQELYRVDTASGQVTRLTDHPAVDGAPSVSPDGAWVAFLSNRDGVWKIWTVPLGGGEAQPLADLQGGVGNWADQVLRWIN